MLENRTSTWALSHHFNATICLKFFIMKIVHSSANHSNVKKGQELLDFEMYFWLFYNESLILQRLITKLTVIVIHSKILQPELCLTSRPKTICLNLWPRLSMPVCSKISLHNLKHTKNKTFGTKKNQHQAVALSFPCKQKKWNFESSHTFQF